MNLPIKKRPTLKDIGDQLGLSKRAVSQALNERESTVKVSDETRKRVREMAIKLGYRENRTAKALTTGRSGMYGILSFQNQVHLSSIRLWCATEALKKRGVLPFVLQCNESTEEGCMRSIEMLIDAGVDGIFLIMPGQSFNASHVKRLSDYGIPAVRLGGAHCKGIPTIHGCRAQGFEMLTRHLLERGHRSLTVLLRQVTPELNNLLSRTPQKTMEGIEAAIRQFGRKVKLNLVELSGEEIDHDEANALGIHPLYAAGYSAMKKILATGKIPDALVCQADGWALGAMKACGEANIRIPEQMVITGYGNDPVGSATYVPLTTVREPIEEMCEAAVSELLSLAAGRPPSSMERNFPGELIVRKSSLR